MSAVLPAPSPGWTAEADAVVVGSGVAGLTAALHARRTGRRVLLVTKGRVEEGSTVWAQGGIAAALADDDSPGEHLHDTLVAGAGLCDVEAVRVLVTEGPAAVRSLIGLGAHFDVDSTGALALTREGGHLRDRIAHAGGDATGAEVSRALVAAVALDPGIELIEGALVLDLLRDEHGAAQGVTLHVMGQGTRDGVGAALAPAVILATGGFGQVFSQTTNPPVATGDGVALGLRAGAEVADLEFVQFHPTVLWLGARARGQQPLVSEAVRGEGALLLDDRGERFMVDVHPLAELAPRDVVSRAILRRMRETGAQHVWLDARAFGEALWEERFPTILVSCREHGIDPVTELVPVAPASHYVSGGVRTDLDGRASIPGLFACGEVAPRRPPMPIESRLPLVPREGMRPLQQAMTDDASVIRSAQSLSRAARTLDDLVNLPGASPCTDDWEASNLQLVARALVHQATLRQETRGSHWREDFPDRDDDRWRVRLVSTLTPSGDLVTRHETVTPGGREHDE